MNNESQWSRAIPLQARPFVKYAGGKTSLLPELEKYLPGEPFKGRYFEPFLGGGALFFHWQPDQAFLNDANPHLTTTYRAIKKDVQGVIDSLGLLEAGYRIDGPRFFLKQRALFNKKEKGETPSLKAARFIFLNKTCFNGLWRVNKSGGFNVPPGKFKTPPTICDRENLEACAKALQGVTITCGDFEAAVKDAKRGDFVYFDSPYAPVDGTSNFTSYTANGFGSEDQQRLRNCARMLKDRGVLIVLSNADVPLVRNLYKRDFKLHAVKARRNINSKGGSRGAVGELIIT